MGFWRAQHHINEVTILQPIIMISAVKHSLENMSIHFGDDKNIISKTKNK
ncbi:MAG: hypothetical protein GX829_07655 [Clostridium sp.]|nr:hypothetical protein [Clostridium sp.]